MTPMTSMTRRKGAGRFMIWLQNGAIVSMTLDPVP
ncbi:hypothetical protein GQ600_3327 [Phytophthora cactorum]|nr:hypothetical protein GQ600_7032 [Phytophthora cactorum]KAF1783483.1 hypothetical protein GQ600_20131 [Phytophthora cactorum]KAF1788391.1 hypothetical protein GQ600_3327 [Phytophthora cactorum]